VTSLLLALLLSAPAPVYRPGSEETERFKAWFTRGEQLFEQGDFGAAIYNFRKADGLRVTPEVAFDLAKCHEKLGDLAYAIHYYRVYLRRAPNATDALEVAEKVGTALAAAEADGRGFLEVESAGASELILNGREFPESPLALFIAPGDYELSAKFPSGPKKMVVQVRTGRAVHVDFEPQPPPLLAVSDALPAGALEGDAAPVRPLRVVGLVTASVGVAALVTGTVLGVLARADATRAQDKALRFPDAQAAASAANTKGLVADVLWGVGGAALAGGVIMFVFSMPEPGMEN
jgi:tetratricopeptide (TPR) repeat protein